MTFHFLSLTISVIYSPNRTIQHSSARPESPLSDDVIAVAPPDISARPEADYFRYVFPVEERGVVLNIL
jgi:hypothetical protein